MVRNAFDQLLGDTTMQQAIYNTTAINTTNTALMARTNTPRTRRSLARTLAQKWDLYAVLTLLASCTTYGVFVLGQVA
jgi:hypothetical protein